MYHGIEQEREDDGENPISLNDILRMSKEKEKKRIYDGRIDDGPEFKSDINGMRWRNTELLSDRAWNARAQSSGRFDRVPFKIKGQGKEKDGSLHF
ncbi:hypothetical protein TNCT_505621 [Trichonephila clavata]|uniref:Uncharacterized protein n=1 Tax=Trichonephila clavata TaxID=2740835 RepID=A0A8X6IK81_TRICU|nr:hypothetical protein TNCT_505621 [Trichonephila clavata]